MNRVFCAPLNPDVDESALFHFFSDRGASVRAAIIVRDRQTGESKGYGFCQLNSLEDFEHALEMDGALFGNRAINVKPAKG